MFNKISKFAIGALMLTLLFTTATFAKTKKQTKTPGINTHQTNQQKRIARGIKNGSINTSEASQLEQQQMQVRNEKKAAKADGVVTKQERATIHNQEKQNKKQIYNAKHN